MSRFLWFSVYIACESVLVC